MRPTIARHSDMPGGKVYNLWWGDKSGPSPPWQTKAAPHWIRSYLFNGYRRISGELFFFGVPIAIGYGVYTWAKNYDEYQNSKAGHLASGGHHE
ncbi:hypothetical protein NLJ89_g10401 [Agrocybe chaxingu]|uniref:Cytochrome b-c1 complex subunit 8 n=1 Tax=Agrocybe chaxingu TaxID=84603 RepID=A0A9W8MSN5_9AGAR|nr:hypothetical protein NLJ89_g10401 [Agrocybe chaxingu]